MKSIVYGGGSWGTALAHLLASAGHAVQLLVRDAEQAQAINTSHINERYLPNLLLHPDVHATTDKGILATASLWVLAIPCQSQRATLEEARTWFTPETVVVNASKGIELASLKLMSQVVWEALGGPRDFASRYAVLSGPSFAKEVMQCKPTAVVLGCADKNQGALLRELFSTPWFRSYSSRDVPGVELGGAVKNVIAIAAGACDGLDFGHNARAALITRGLAEIQRLGVAMGAASETFRGLSGLGDLLLTCTGDLSRNRQVGMRLGKGEQLTSIVASMQMVAEGVKTTEAVHGLAQALDVEMPITQSMYQVLQANLSPMDAVTDLMSRSLKEEVGSY